MQPIPSINSHLFSDPPPPPPSQKWLTREDAVLHYFPPFSSSFCTHFPLYLLEALYILLGMIPAGLSALKIGPKGRSSRPEIY
jgi:hypothetical protein